MPTLKKRVNISLSDELDKVLSLLAKRDRVPQATKAADLLKIAVELEEDLTLEKLVNKRVKNKGRFLSHDEVWS